jgi:hypothetical protein
MECFQVVYETNSMALEVEIETNMSIFAIINRVLNIFIYLFFSHSSAFHIEKKRERETL